MDSNDVRREWAERSGEFSPEYYAYRGPDETSERIRSVLDREVGTDASVLELGCSAGRHLAHLADNGYDDLHGVDINEESFDVMAEAYPDLAETGTFYVDAIESVVERFDDDRFDAVYSVETLQHIHPDNDEVFDEVTRIADELVVTVENEAGEEGSADDESENGSDAESVNYVNDDFPLYYRDWNAVFTDLGWVEIESASGDRDTMRVFRPA